MNNEYQLDIFPGDFQLPSIDLESLIALTYCSLAEIRIRINANNNLYFKKLPSFRADNQIIYGVEDIIDYIERKDFNSEFIKQSSKHKFDICCYKTLLETKLEPCLQYLFWYDEENYNENIGCWYAEKSPFPTNFIVPRTVRNNAILKLEKNFTIKILENDNRAKLIEKKVLADAFECLNIISRKLNRNFLLGDKPTAIDAYVFSYLALLYQLPVKKEIIKAHIRNSPNLEKFTQRILNQYFNKYQKIDFNHSDQNKLNDNYLSFKWYDVFFSGCVATFLMVYYAFSNGIISTKLGTDCEEYDEEEEEQEEQQQ